MCGDTVYWVAQRPLLAATCSLPVLGDLSANASKCRRQGGSGGSFLANKAPGCRVGISPGQGKQQEGTRLCGKPFRMRCHLGDHLEDTHSTEISCPRLRYLLIALRVHFVCSGVSWPLICAGTPNSACNCAHRTEFLSNEIFSVSSKF